jgi:hypothetical protein
VKANFNVYHFFAGAFVPFWLLSRQEIDSGAKLTYAAMAQQANSRGAVQLHFRVQAAALGEDEGQLSRHLMELKEVGLIQVSRGNVSQEDIRVFFPPHPWMTGIEQPPQAVTTQPAGPEAATSPQLFPEADPPTHASLSVAAPGRCSRSPAEWSREETWEGAQAAAVEALVRGLPAIRHVPEGGLRSRPHLERDGARATPPPVGPMFEDVEALSAVRTGR